MHVNVKSRAKLTKETDAMSWKLLVKWPSFIKWICRKGRETCYPSSIAFACELCSGLWHIVNYSYSQLLTVLQCFTNTPHTITWYLYPAAPYHPPGSGHIWGFRPEEHRVSQEHCSWMWFTRSHDTAVEKKYVSVKIKLLATFSKMHVKRYH